MEKHFDLIVVGAGILGTLSCSTTWQKGIAD